MYPLDFQLGNDPLIILDLFIEGNLEQENGTIDETYDLVREYLIKSITYGNNLTGNRSKEFFAYKMRLEAIVNKLANKGMLEPYWPIPNIIDVDLRRLQLKPGYGFQFSKEWKRGEKRKKLIKCFQWLVKGGFLFEEDFWLLELLIKSPDNSFILDLMLRWKVDKRFLLSNLHLFAQGLGRHRVVDGRNVYQQAANTFFTQEKKAITSESLNKATPSANTKREEINKALSYLY